MKKTHPTLTALLLLLAVPSAARAHRTETEHEVRVGFAAFGEAFLDADVAARRSELDSGEMVITTYDVEDVQVHLCGEAAVVTGVVRSRGQRGGVSFSSDVRFTNLWVRQRGVWQRAAFHDSALPESGS